MADLSRRIAKAMSSRGMKGVVGLPRHGLHVQGVGRFGTEERPSCCFRGFSLFARVEENRVEDKFSQVGET